MLTFVISMLFVGALVFAGYGIWKACSLIAAHVQGNPDAGKAIFDHVFMPLFGNKKESPQNGQQDSP